MSEIYKNVNSYEEFEYLLDQNRNNQVILEKYKSYIQKHFTSQRAKRLEDIFMYIELSLFF